MNTTKTKQNEQLYDVVIYEKATRKIDAIIGKDLKCWDGQGSGRNTAELRVQTGQERINERYGCRMVAAGQYQNGDVLPNDQAHRSAPGGTERKETHE
jgi:hypothetical protein